MISNAECSQCGMRNAECGMKSYKEARNTFFAVFIPHSEFRIPHFTGVQ